ncbi:MAG: (E)-4-hydroxy-3-methylbut-2-enyl-diphosphate synthase [Bacteroidales bacterium]|nr:(E)-4-hydroxy-3-methylbut-2-enyl-diphosphate synthase [Bacteroidales bacterium]
MEKIICKVGNIEIGAGRPIVIQSMCNTDTNDIEASVAQCIELVKAGSQIVRLTTQGLREVESLGKIRARLRELGYSVPLVADIHFNADAALAAAAGIADKVRINPGNFSKDHVVAMEKFATLVGICKEYGTAIRIGLNHGSLGERITSLYGDTPKGMCEAVMEWIRECIRLDFHNVVISLKASNTKVMVDAYRLLHKTMAEETCMVFPLHLGVTEAGNGDTGRIKSAVGIGTLLSEGIGDTIRVSLTENPANELAPARMLADYGDSIRNGISQCFDNHIFACSWEEFLIKASVRFGPALLDCKADDFVMSGEIAGETVSHERIEYFRDALLQACRRRFTKPEYIACPSCGRTLYDIESVLEAIKEATADFAGVKIAVMGCIVNGPGEMADADFGYVGEGGGKITLYKGKQPVMRGIDQHLAVEKLVELIKSENF